MKKSEQLIHVAVIEDDPDTRQMWQMLIDSQPKYSCKHTYECMEDALENLPNYPYINVVMVDIEIKINGVQKMDGIEGIYLMKNHPRLEQMDFIMLTVHDETKLIFRALKNGATGYMKKDSPIQKILAAIEEVTLGGSPMSMSIARKIRNYFYKAKLKNPLTGQEMEILERTAEGKDAKTIAAELYISYHTVREHYKNMYRKLQVHSRTQLITKARKMGLID